MGSKHRPTFRTVILAAVVAAGLSLTGCGDSSSKTADSAASASSTASSPAPASGTKPTKVVLPGGQSATLTVGSLNDDGELPVPEKVTEAAWWGAGVGASRGTMLLSGHVNWKGQKGPFEQIHHVTMGQKVNVTDANGKQLTYTISEILDINKKDLPAKSDELFSRTGPHRLVLVTCGGDYIGGVTGYENNRIVIATL